MRSKKKNVYEQRGVDFVPLSGHPHSKTKQKSQSNVTFKKPKSSTRLSNKRESALKKTQMGIDQRLGILEETIKQDTTLKLVKQQLDTEKKLSEQINSLEEGYVNLRKEHSIKGLFNNNWFRFASIALTIGIFFDGKLTDLSSKIDLQSSDINRKIDLQSSDINKKIDDIFNRVDTKIDNQFNALNTRIDRFTEGRRLEESTQFHMSNAQRHENTSMREFESLSNQNKNNPALIKEKNEKKQR